jgi:hypothetical protein
VVVIGRRHQREADRGAKKAGAGAIEHVENQ